MPHDSFKAVGDVDRAVTILYTNYQNSTRLRRIVPMALHFGTTEYHPKPQWLLEAVDLESGDFRDFAVSGIRWAEGQVHDSAVINLPARGVQK